MSQITLTSHLPADRRTHFEKIGKLLHSGGLNMKKEGGKRERTRNDWNGWLTLIRFHCCLRMIPKPLFVSSPVARISVGLRTSAKWQTHSLTRVDRGMNQCVARSLKCTEQLRSRVLCILCINANLILVSLGGNYLPGFFHWLLGLGTS